MRWNTTQFLGCRRNTLSVLPQLGLYFLHKKLQMLLQFAPPPLVGGAWEYAEHLLKRDKWEGAETARERAQLPNRPAQEEGSGGGGRGRRGCLQRGLEGTSGLLTVFISATK